MFKKLLIGYLSIGVAWTALVIFKWVKDVRKINTLITSTWNILAWPYCIFKKSVGGNVVFDNKIKKEGKDGIPIKDIQKETEPTGSESKPQSE